MRHISSFLGALLITASLLWLHNAASAQRQEQPQNMPIPPVLQKYQPVTNQRLKNPEDGNWLMIRRTYDGWGYSPLDQITPANVSRLHPAWAGIFSGDIEDSVRHPHPCLMRRIAVWRSMAIRCTTLQVKPFSLRWMRERARKCGQRRSPTTNPAITSLSLR